MTEQRPQAFDQLKEQLKEMFQLDRGELDFGIYRIMNQKRDEITKFLEKQLLPEVHAVLAEYQTVDGERVQNELNKQIANLKNAQVDPEKSPRVKELRAQLEMADLSKLEQEIYSDLHNFFKRYYSEGDFMSLRRYKEGVYALPYEGEEVKLHWANHDQYYIKTSENLKNYSFKTPSGKRVRFEVVAGSTETNNSKAAEGKERRFLLHKKEPLMVTADELTIRFEYRPDDSKQVDINKETSEYLRNLAEVTNFSLNQEQPTEQNPERTLLEKHLTDFTAKNTFDYFIHKDIDRFLRRELDFYIKNEIMYLDDIENETAKRVETYLAKVKAMRKVAGKIIQFLAQLEDFQKKLWLKKKFVLETHYCVTLDHIIGSEAEEVLLPIIAANSEQRTEWVQLFNIDDLSDYDTPLSVSFLKNNDKLLVDTKFFDATFKYRLLSLFDDLDEQINGVMVNSENFQALNLLQARYRGKVRCIYIDPPYNTERDRNEGKFLYKDNYAHSSWLSFMSDRIKLSYNFLQPNGTIYCSIGEDEVANLKTIFEQIYTNNLMVNCIWISGRTSASHFTNAHEYVVGYAKDKNSLPFFKYTGDSSSISDRAIKRVGVKNPASIIYFPARSVDFESEDKIFPNQLGDKEIIKIVKGVFESKNRKLANNVSILAGWTMKDMIEKWLSGNEVYDNKGQRIQRFFFKENGVLQYEKDRGTIHPKSIIENITTKQGTKELYNFFGVSDNFSFPKPTNLVNYFLSPCTDKTSTILDYFSGSGTTGHAIINLNREDGGKRKYILVEMGECFDSVAKQRILKAIYSKDWKDGKPTSFDGVSQVVQYMALEQYEDTLDNLDVKKSKTQAALLENDPELNEQYMLGYMLDMESRGSQSLLNIDLFANPFAYKLRINRNDDTQTVNVDLVETFNYLLGLTIRTVNCDKSGIVTVTGENSLGENCLIIWRNIAEIDNYKLDKWFKNCYNIKELDFDVIYVNGDNNIENLKPADGHWKARLIEAEFKHLMFDVQGI